jgi:hypothetical protein
MYDLRLATQQMHDKAQYVRKIKKMRICCYILAFAMFNPVYGISIPEGIRGFTVTYGTWIESVLSQSILKDILFPEDQEQYNKFQRLIITSERLSEEGNNKDALSYLRKAEFYLQDSGKTLGRKFGLTNADYTLEEMRGFPENVREAWAMYQFQQISLFIEYEYYSVLNNVPGAEYFAYVQKIVDKYKTLDENTAVYKNIQNSNFSFYLSQLQSSWIITSPDSKSFSLDQMMDYLAGHQEELLNDNGYWKKKFIKRSIILLSKYGYPEKAWYLMNRLVENNPDILPVKVNFNLMVYNAKYAQAENYILDIINTIKINDLNHWGVYITYEKYYLNLLLLQKKYNAYNSNLDKFISQLNIFLQRIDLTRDVYEYIEYHVNDAALNKIMVNEYENENAEDIKIFKINTSEFTAASILEKEQLLKSYAEDTFSFKFDNAYTAYRTFQYHLKNQHFQLADAALLKLEKFYPESELLPLARLKYALFNTRYNKEFRVRKEDWYKMWIQSIYTSLGNPALMTSINTGLIIHFNFESEFFRFYSEQKVPFTASELIHIISALSTIASWENKMLIPPAYNRPLDYKIRYLYLSKWGFPMSEEPLNSPEKFLSFDMFNDSFKDTSENNKICDKENPCWILYPVKDSLYSLIINNLVISPVVAVQNLSEIISLSNAFYSNLENSKKNKDILETLAALSEKLSPVTQQVESLINPDHILRLNAFKIMQLLPVESILTKGGNTHLGDKYKIVRKLPRDQSYDISCESPNCKNTIKNVGPVKKTTRADETGDHFFLGVGNISPGFIIANSNIDELLDIEGLFAKKRLFPESSSLSENIIHSFEDGSNFIFHIAGQWIPNDNNPALVVENKKNGMPLDNLRYIESIPYITLSKQRSLNFNAGNYEIWNEILTSFRYKNTNIAVASLAVSPKEFRQAFYYDLYYRIEYKKSEWLNAFFSSIARTKKGFSDSIWPYLMVIYEK